MKITSASLAYSSWADEFRPLAQLAFESWMATGEWMSVDQLQRELDRRGLDIDVIAAAERIPRLHGEQRAVMPSAISLPIRVLHELPEATVVLRTSMAIVRRAISLYLSDSEGVEVTDTDEELIADPDVEISLLGRAAALISSDYPNPFSGGATGNDSWSLNVNVSRVRKFRGVQTLTDYLDRQADVLSHIHPFAGPESPAEISTSIFVIMPFGTTWSAGIYDLIKRATESLRPEHDVAVYRADEIARPGKITDQIVDAIRECDAVIADITENNANVMWELGYAQALRKPAVILNQSIHEAPFDLKDWRQVVYGRTPTEVDARKLAEHIREVLNGPRLDVGV